jgi:two-component system, chemotaxis family, chemotaxis protein CheY
LADGFFIARDASVRNMSSHSQLLTQSPAQSLVPKHLEDLIRSIKILIVDDDYHMRKVVRTMLSAIGVREIHDAADGMAGLQAICAITPDIVILDWEMPQVGGAEFMRSVRSPGSFPVPNVPIIVLTGHGERSCVLEATQLGANEYLLKPVSTKALFDRVVSVLARPRPMVKIGDYYGPKPRKNAASFDYAFSLPSEQYAERPRTEVPPLAPPQADRQEQPEPDTRENRDDIVLI